MLYQVTVTLIDGDQLVLKAARALCSFGRMRPGYLILVLTRYCGPHWVGHPHPIMGALLDKITGPDMVGTLGAQPDAWPVREPQASALGLAGGNARRVLAWLHRATS